MGILKKIWNLLQIIKQLHNLKRKPKHLVKLFAKFLDKTSEYLDMC